MSTRTVATTIVAGSLLALAAVPALATTPTPSPSPSTTPVVVTSQTISDSYAVDPATYPLASATVGSADGRGYKARTDVSYAAWWLSTHGVTVGTTGNVLSPTGIVGTPGSAYNWTATAKKIGDYTFGSAFPAVFAVYAKSAAINVLNPSTYAVTGKTKASSSLGAIALITKTNSNHTMQISTYVGGAYVSETVPSTGAGLTFAYFGPSLVSTGGHVLLHNTKTTALTVLFAATTGGGANPTIAAGATYTVNVPTLTPALTPYSFYVDTVISGKTKKYGSNFAVKPGTTTTITLK